MIGAASLNTPSLLAQNSGSIRVSATVVSVAPEREAEQQAQAQGLRFASMVGQAQREVSQRVSTTSRLAQVTTARVSTVRNGRPEEAEAVRVTVEYAAN